MQAQCCQECALLSDLMVSFRGAYRRSGARHVHCIDEKNVSSVFQLTPAAIYMNQFIAQLFLLLALSVFLI